MDYETYKEGMAFAAVHIKEYGVEYARGVIEGIFNLAEGRMYLSNYALGYLDTVELAETIMGKGRQE